MKIPKFLDDLSVISKLGDNPGADNGLTAEGLKAKFDEAGLKLQIFLNETLIEKINSLFSLDAPPHEGMNMTGPINMNKNKLGGLADPAEDGDAVNLKFANKSYRAASWMPTIAEIGAAPDGFGLGGAAKRLTSADDLNTIWACGDYAWYDSTPANAPSFGGASGASYSVMKVISSYEHSFVQEVTHYYYGIGNLTQKRTKTETLMGEWEWVNPPMVPGVEYRTTKRWNGKPVYTMLIPCGTMPTAGGTNRIVLPSTINGWVDRVLRANGSDSGGNSIPYSWKGEYITEVSASRSAIYIYAKDDFSSNTADVQIWYVRY